MLILSSELTKTLSNDSSEQTIQLANLVWSQFNVPAGSGMRVSVDDYGSNLRETGESCRNVGADVWFITAPHALDVGIPPYLLTSGEVDDPAFLVSIHQCYNSGRKVAAEQQAAVIDFEDEIAPSTRLRCFWMTIFTCRFPDDGTLPIAFRMSFANPERLRTE